MARTRPGVAPRTMLRGKVGGDGRGGDAPSGHVQTVPKKQRVPSLEDDNVGYYENDGHKIYITTPIIKKSRLFGGKENRVKGNKKDAEETQVSDVQE